MGGHPWMYFVPYEGDLQAALDKLKERELRAGRYNPAMPSIPFPVDPAEPAPGAKHASVEAARAAADADGTRSILDMDRVVTEPRVPGVDDGMVGLQEHLDALADEGPGGLVDLGQLDVGALMGAAGFGVVTPVAADQLRRLYGTTTPSREAVAKAPDFLDDLERGTGVYVILYEGETPTGICFAGYSYD